MSSYEAMKMSERKDRTYVELYGPELAKGIGRRIIKVFIATL